MLLVKVNEENIKEKIIRGGKMYCPKCKQDISPDCCYDNICVFCYHSITEWDSNGALITRYEAIKPIICPNCFRQLPNNTFFAGRGCKWCISKEMRSLSA